MNDRIENAGANSRTYSKFFTLPMRIPLENFKNTVNQMVAASEDVIQLDATAQKIYTTNPTNDNVSVRFFGQNLTFGGVLKPWVSYPNKEFFSFPTSVVGRVKAELDLIAMPTTTQISTIAAKYAKNQMSMRWNGIGNQSLVSLVYTKPFENGISGADLTQVTDTSTAEGLSGFSAVSRTGAKIYFQSSKELSHSLTAGPAAMTGESLLAVDKNGEISGIVLGSPSVSINGTTYNGPSNSFQYVLSSDGTFTATPIYKPIDTAVISPEQTSFTESIQVSFNIPTQDTSDIEYHYTLDGSDPTIESTLYTGPFTISDTTRVKVRPFRKGLTSTPWNVPGVDGGKTVSAIFEKENYRAATSLSATVNGLNYAYFEDTWMKLFTYAGMNGILNPVGYGAVKNMLVSSDVATVRKTDKAYALRYEGFIKVPETGVYKFYAPQHLYTPTMDAGYDLRVFIDDEEWFPNPSLHAENIWDIPLSSGYHKFKVSFADYRNKTFKNDYWMMWRPEEMWSGLPKLEVEGPNVSRQAVPDSWLYRKIIDSPTWATNQSLTSGNVTVTINAPSDSLVKEYKMGTAGTWQVYTNPIVLSENQKVYARRVDADGNMSPEVSLDVNVDLVYINDSFETGMPDAVRQLGTSATYTSGTICGWTAGSPNSITAYNAVDGKNNSYYIYTKDNSKALPSPVNKNGTYFDVKCKLTGYQAPYSGGNMILYDSANSAIFIMANPHWTAPILYLWDDVQKKTYTQGPTAGRMPALGEWVYYRIYFDFTNKKVQVYVGTSVDNLKPWNDSYQSYTMQITRLHR